MSAPVDVLAVMDRASLLLPGSKAAVVTKIELCEARAAVAELIEAGKALQEAMEAPEKGPFDSLTVKQFHDADARHRAALIACGATLARV